jgi:AraC-like DNA-binding protein
LELKPTIFETGRRLIDSAWKAADVYSTFWRLYCNDRGGAELQLDHGVYKVDPGRFHVIPAWVRFSCRCHHPVDHQYAHFILEGLPGVVSRDVFDRPFAFEADSPRGVHFADVWPEALGHLHTCTRIYASLAIAFDRLSDADMAKCRPYLCGSHRFGPLLDWIEQHLAQPLTSQMLAGKAHLSIGQFIRTFHQEIGQPPNQYVRERRITAASQRLRFTDDSIESIASDFGFADRFYFSRVFKQVMHVAPATYRRSQQV